MPIGVKFFAGKDGKPLVVKPRVRTPFGAQHKIDWSTGKHIPLVPEKKANDGVSTTTKLLTVVTDIRFDSDSGQLQVKTREVMAIVTRKAETDWTMITGGQTESCDDA